MLSCIVKSCRNGVRVTLYSGAGRQHGACSETFWGSCIMLFVFPGKDGRVTERTESLPESQMDNTYFPFSLHRHTLSHSLFLSLLCYSLGTASIIYVAFSCVWHWNKDTMLSSACYSCLFFSQFITCLSNFSSSICSSTFLLSP